MSTKRHPVDLSSCDLSSPEAIGKSLALLRFDVMLLILRAWWQELSKQAFADRKRGRHQLAQALFDAADRFGPVARCLDLAWRISEPYMKTEIHNPRLFNELSSPQKLRYARRLSDSVMRIGQTR